ncbi:hypothetical protein N5D52_26720, partial [Pseudomonas sp. GD03860]
LKDAKSEFKNVKGVWDPELEHWESTLTIPGMSGCNIEGEDEGFSFFCKIGKSSTREEAVRSAEILAREVRSCLAGAVEESSEYRENTVNGYLVKTYSGVRFLLPKSSVYVSVRAYSLEHLKNKNLSYVANFEVVLDEDLDE